ncbi:MAG: Fe-S cluster assembly protein SufD [Planctomycetota bacterium]
MVTSRVDTPAERFLNSFALQAADRDPGAGWLEALRRQAAGRARELGFPQRRSEDWRYSHPSVSRVLALDLQPATPSPSVPRCIEELSIRGLSGPRLVFVNGRLADAGRPAPWPQGVQVGSLARALTEDPEGVRAHFGRAAPSTEHAFGHLNTALFRDGAFVRIPKGVRLESPVELIFITQSAGRAEASHVRNLIVVEPGAEATVLEVHGSADRVGTYFSNVVTEASVADQAKLTHVRLHQESAATFHVAGLRARQAKESRFESHFVALGGAFVRNEIELRIEGEQAQGSLSGVFVVDGERQVDNSTVIHHLVPHGTSHEVYKGVLAGASQGTFKGKIFVHLDAQKTDAKQSSAGLLLSDDAIMNTQPNLEIYADDVRCTHGATVGQLRDDALFYLRSRGIDRNSARRLLTLAFVGDVLRGLENDVIRDAIEERSTQALDRILQ